MHELLTDNKGAFIEPKFECWEDGMWLQVVVRDNNNETYTRKIVLEPIDQKNEPRDGFQVTYRSHRTDDEGQFEYQANNDEGILIMDSISRYLNQSENRI
jgi:hypothetical protein